MIVDVNALRSNKKIRRTLLFQTKFSEPNITVSMSLALQDVIVRVP